MIGANPHRGCTDYDRGAEIWGVRFRDRLMVCVTTGGPNSGLWRTVVRLSVTSGPAAVGRDFVSRRPAQPDEPARAAQIPVWLHRI
jgi:hypothetical protein